MQNYLILPTAGYVFINSFQVLVPSALSLDSFECSIFKSTDVFFISESVLKSITWIIWIIHFRYCIFISRRLIFFSFYSFYFSTFVFMFISILDIVITTWFPYLLITPFLSFQDLSLLLRFTIFCFMTCHVFLVGSWTLWMSIAFSGGFCGFLWKMLVFDLVGS